MASKSPYPMLVVDAGNTSVKFAIVARRGGSPKLLQSVSTSALTMAMAKRFGTRAKSVAVSSVVPAASRILQKAFPQACFIGPTTRLNFKTMADRQTIGSDRLANVAAAQARYKKNILVLSFGTATTFDLIDAKGVHRGGAIAPGWKAFAEILHERTAQLPHVHAKKTSRFIARNTRGALAAGQNGGYAAMVSHIVKAMKKEARLKKLRVVFTGGNAATVARILPWKAVSDPLLTLRGIALLARGSAREASK